MRRYQVEAIERQLNSVIAEKKAKFKKSLKIKPNLTVEEKVGLILKGNAELNTCVTMDNWDLKRGVNCFSYPKQNQIEKHNKPLEKKIIQYEAKLRKKADRLIDEIILDGKDSAMPGIKKFEISN